MMCHFLMIFFFSKKKRKFFLNHVIDIIVIMADLITFKTGDYALTCGTNLQKDQQKPSNPAGSCHVVWVGVQSVRMCDSFSAAVDK